MTAVIHSHPNNQEHLSGRLLTQRKAALGDHVETLSDIYQDDTNIAIWQRDLALATEYAVDRMLTVKPNIRIETVVTPQDAYVRVSECVDVAGTTALCEDGAELVEMFCYLFELKQVGLRLHVVRGAMCPKFHEDRVPCRLITTYRGAAMEWLPHAMVDRSKLGHGSLGLSDSQSGLYQNAKDIEQLKNGHVALLKGTLWPGNEQAGLIHRSPATASTDERLLLTLDFVD